MKHEIIIQVNSLKCCGYFYRETLKLGEPVIETRDTVVFVLGEEAALILRENPAEYLEHASSAVSFSIYTPNFDTIIDELEKSGELTGEQFTHLGFTARRVCDPEGNVISLIKTDV